MRNTGLKVLYYTAVVLNLAYFFPRDSWNPLTHRGFLVVRSILEDMLLRMLTSLWFVQYEATCHTSRETVAILNEQFPEIVISLQHRPGNSDNGYDFPCINRRCYSEYGSNILFQFSLKFVSIIEFSKLVLNLLPLQCYQI